MRYLAFLAAGVLLIGLSGQAGAGFVSPAGLSNDGLSPIEYVQAAPKSQDKPKSETVKQQVKRIWREWTGYKFDVGCPILLPLTRTTCTETGKNRDEARAKCQARHPFCLITEAGKR